MKETPSFKEIVVKTFKILKGYKRAYMIIIVFCILAAVFNSIAPYFLGYATDSLYNSFTKHLPFDHEFLIRILMHCQHILKVIYHLNLVKR